MRSGLVLTTKPRARHFLAVINLTDTRLLNVDPLVHVSHDLKTDSWKDVKINTVRFNESIKV